MNRFRNLWHSTNSPPDSSSTPMAQNESTTTISGRRIGATVGGLVGHRRSQSQSQSESHSRRNASRPHLSNLDQRGASQYSAYSSQGPFQPRISFSENFMLGAGAVIIQPSSGKVVIVQDGNSWFLPKGRKDLGESIEQAALREAYEEVSFSFDLISPDRI